MQFLSGGLGGRYRSLERYGSCQGGPVVLKIQFLSEGSRSLENTVLAGGSRRGSGTLEKFQGSPGILKMQFLSWGVWEGVREF